MSDLTYVEKQKFERFLGMSSGYVMNFSNRTLQEFILESTGRDIYDPRYDYNSGSKANRLRAFWLKEDNKTVGKLMKDMLDLSEDTGPTKDVCYLIAGRLLGQSNPASQTTSANSQAKESLQRSQAQHSQALAGLREEFSQLAFDADRNKAGLALERLLNRLFSLFELRPRQPFKIVGEQIDGSFELDGQIYLVESKWENHALSEAPLLVFRGKIEGKSTFTRGVFIALNDISAQARDAITRGKAASFFVMNGHDLMMILSEAMSLPDFLRKRVRLLAEEGRVCVPFSEL
jgi:hypothetical protein